MLSLSKDSKLNNSINQELQQNFSPSSFLYGSVAGATGVYVGFPFDTIKAKMQADFKGTYRNELDCIIKTFQNDAVIKINLLFFWYSKKSIFNFFFVV